MASVASRVNVQFPGNLPAVENVSQLRAVPSFEVAAKAAYLVQGSVSFGDGRGGIYSYDPGSLANDDGSLVVKPFDRTPLQAGRWILTTGTGGEAMDEGIWSPDAAIVDNEGIWTP